MKCFTFQHWPIVFLLIISPVKVSSFSSKDGPFFIREPPEVVEFNNDTGVTISCIASGSPNPTIKWMFQNNKPVVEIENIIQIREGDTLVFPPFKSQNYQPEIHSAIYYCLASNTIGSIKSRDVNVKGVLNEKYSLQVYDEFVLSGNTAVLRCNIPNSAKHFLEVVSWIEDSNHVISALNLNYTDRYTVFPNGDLHIRRVEQKDSTKSYKCQAKNKLNGKLVESVNSGRFFVQESYINRSPRIKDSKSLIVAKEGERVLLPCAAQGHPVPTYTWYRSFSSSPYTDTFKPISHDHLIMQLDGTLVIRQAVLSDNGKYRCFVNNSIGSESVETELVVTTPLFSQIIPPYQSVDIGSSVTFNCTFTGHPTPNVEWFKNGIKIVPNSQIRLLPNNVLYIKKVERNDKGIYQCFVWNSFHSFQSSSSLDLKDDAPVFLETFKDQILEENFALSLKCIASGNPLPQVTWLLDGQPVPDNSRFRIGDFVTKDGLLVSYVNITSVISQDGGYFQCTASNDVASIKHTRRINIYGPPFVRPMKNISAVAGESMVLNCPATGYPIESIHWERENVRLPYNHRQKVYANGTLVVTDIERTTDAGKYLCRVKNKGQSASNFLYINILVRPVIDPFTFPNSLHSGQRYNMLCSITKGDSPIKIRWFKDGKPIESSGLKLNSIGIEIIHVNEFSSTLTFESLRPDHRGTYSCLASNIAGTVQHNATMIIHVPPTWRIEPNDTAAVKGQIAVIDCQSEGFPQPQTGWSKAEGYLQEPFTDYKSIISNSHLRVFENGSLVIYNVQKSDGGYYLCQSRNGIEPSLSKVIKLTINVAAHFKTKFSAETVRKGQETRLKCNAFGDKPLSISWLKDKISFNPRDDVRYELIEVASDEGITSEIVIRNSDRRDSALFTCLTFNSYGQDDTNIQLIMQEPPDSPQDIKVVEFNGRSVSISWSPSYSGNSPILHYVIQYKPETEKWNSRNMLNATMPGSVVAFEIKNLNPVTYYHLRIFAINAIGKSESSEVIRFKTDEEAPGGPPLHIKAISISSSSIRVTWKPPRKDLTFGQVKGFYVGYKLTSNLNTFDKNPYIYKTLERTENNLAEECIITGLNKLSKYSIIVQAFNNKGAGPASEEIFVQTLENDSPHSPTLKVVEKKTDLVKLSWSNKELKSDVVTGFIIYYKSVESDDMKQVELSGDKSSYLFKGLKCGTRYQYYIIAFNEIGKSDPSNVVSVVTEGSAPVAPDSLSLLTINTTFVIIHLDSWHNGGCSITGFEIMYKESQSDQWITLRTKDSVIVKKTNKNEYLNNIKPSTLYDLKITAYNEAGPTQAQYSFTTLNVYKAPISVSFGNQASSSTNSVYLDYSLIMSTSVIIGITLITMFLLFCIVFVKKRYNNNRLYESSTIYESSKRHPQSQNVLLNQLNSTNMKKISADCTSVLDSNLFPSPYVMTKIETNDKEERRNDSNHLHSSSLKKFTANDEPIYATVKRTPRPPRSDVHIYHFPIGHQNNEQSLDFENSWNNELHSQSNHGTITSSKILNLNQPLERCLSDASVSAMHSIYGESQPLVIYSQHNDQQLSS